MGMDIYMHIIDSHGEYMFEDIFTDRCSEWFDNLRGVGWDREYELLPIEYGILDFAPDKIKKLHNDSSFFDFRHIRVGDFMEWYETRKPNIDAGWVSKFDSWLYKTKNIPPENVVHYLPSDACEKDICFLEFEKMYDNSRWLYEFLVEKNVSPDCYIVYYFS